MHEAWEEFKAMTDPVSVWIENNTVEHADALVTKSALLAAYNRGCEKQGRAGMTSNSFGRALKRARPQLGDAQRTVSGKLSWCWVGIGLHQDGPYTDDSSDSHYSHNSRDYTNCIESGETPQKEGEDREKRTDKTSKGNRVNHVNNRIASTSTEMSEEQEARIHGLVLEGMSERLAREAVLGKSWVEP